jgi:rhodanese-related sulfurtransferase
VKKYFHSLNKRNNNGFNSFSLKKTNKHLRNLNQFIIWLFHIKPKLNAMNAQISFYEQKLNYEMDAWDVHEAISKGENMFIIDARSKESFADEHIEGAVNIHHRLMTPESTAHIDKNALCVIYCSGVGCNASTKGALKMTQLGFKVKELIGGIEWWKREGYPTVGVSLGKKVLCDCQN